MTVIYWLRRDLEVTVRGGDDLGFVCERDRLLQQPVVQSAVRLNCSAWLHPAIAEQSTA